MLKNFKIKIKKKKAFLILLLYLKSVLECSVGLMVSASVG